MAKKARIYLDYAAGAEGNPSSPHAEGRSAREKLEQARVAIARLMEVKADDIVFTSGATEANNIAIQGLSGHKLYLPSAHASVVETMQKSGGEPLVVTNGKIDIEALKTQLRPDTVLVSVDAVCGETGTIWNTREVKISLDKLGTKRPLLHVDASQAPLTQKVTRAHFGADLLTFDSAKVGGPRGIGCLVAHRTIPLKPILFGGGQERALRPGSESPELAEGFAKALTKAVKGREGFATRAVRLRASLWARIQKAISNVYINEGAEVAPNILNLSLVGRDTDYLVALLDAAGFAVSTKSACETDSLTPSRAVFALTADTKRAESTLRISWGPTVREKDLRVFLKELVVAVEFLDKPSPKSHY